MVQSHTFVCRPPTVKPSKHWKKQKSDLTLWQTEIKINKLCAYVNKKQDTQELTKCARVKLSAPHFKCPRFRLLDLRPQQTNSPMPFKKYILNNLKKELKNTTTNHRVLPQITYFFGHLLHGSPFFCALP